jgi:hypothetical protein
MPSNKKSLSEEQIFADIMEMISSNSNKKSKNVKNSKSEDENKKSKNVKSSNSKRNLKGGFAPIDGSDMDMHHLASQMQNSPNQPGRAMGINVEPNGVQSDMGNSGGVMPMMQNMEGMHSGKHSMKPDSMMGGKAKKSKSMMKPKAKKMMKSSVKKVVKPKSKKVVKPKSKKVVKPKSKKMMKPKSKKVAKK